MADGHIVAEKFSGGTTATDYFVLDHLGSVAVVMNDAGTVLERLSYDAWGQRLGLCGDGTFTTACYAGSSTTRGFTNQEEIDGINLVNLNARIYDPVLGQMMSADTVTANWYDGQDLNRYAYALNDPLTFADPSGHTPIENVDITADRYPMPSYDAVSFYKPISFATDLDTRRPEVGSGDRPPKKTDKNKKKKKKGTNREKKILQCVANSSDAGGIVGGVVGGAGAFALGSPILPYSLFGKPLTGGGPSGGTSVLSAAARGFLGKNFVSSLGNVGEDSGSVWQGLSDFYNTGSKSAIVGRAASDFSVVVGLGLEAYGGYKVYKAYKACEAQVGG